MSRSFRPNCCTIYVSYPLLNDWKSSASSNDRHQDTTTNTFSRLLNAPLSADALYCVNLQPWAKLQHRGNLDSEITHVKKFHTVVKMTTEGGTTGNTSCSITIDCFETELPRKRLNTSDMFVCVSRVYQNCLPSSKLFWKFYCCSNWELTDVYWTSNFLISDRFGKF